MCKKKVSIENNRLRCDNRPTRDEAKSYGKKKKSPDCYPGGHLGFFVMQLHSWVSLGQSRSRHRRRLWYTSYLTAARRRCFFITFRLLCSGLCSNCSSLVQHEQNKKSLLFMFASSHATNTRTHTRTHSGSLSLTRLEHTVAVRLPCRAPAGP